jgi:pyridoxal phosphate enzyme (YggS family)
MSIAKRVLELQKQVHRIQNPTTPVQIMAVTKYATVDQMAAIIDSGLTLLGENKIQDALVKQAHFKDKSIAWHFIGHLQRNKLQKALQHFDMIQSVDRFSLASALSEAALAHHKKIPVLVEVNLANDPNKFGFSASEIEESHAQLFGLAGLDIQGLMTIPPVTATAKEARPYFAETKKLYDHLKSIYTGISILSMGMSADYQIAIEEGSTLIRVGSYLTQD